MKMEESNLVKLLNDQVMSKLSEETIKVNDKEYISMDLFINLMRESMMTEVLLGSILHRLGDIELTDEEILMYISERFENTEIGYKDGRYTLLSNRQEK